jgi:SAM-dependent methyltransferase
MITYFSTLLGLKEISIFMEGISSKGNPVNILDVGGTEDFWIRMGLAGDNNYQITILNLVVIKTHYSNLESVIGDARKICFKDHGFDFIFSHSVIEHVGDFDNQSSMAHEIQRVGENFFLQTPNRYFPLEPHFIFPFFQFFPINVKIFLLCHFNLGHYRKTDNKTQALNSINEIRLLNKEELKYLFPKSKIINVKILFFTSSYNITNM